MHFVFLIMILLCNIHTKAKATHIVGGDMSYVCLGDGWYELTLVIRRDCGDDHHTGFDSLARIDVFDGYGTPLDYFGGVGAVFLPKIRQEIVSIEPQDCADACAPELCMEEAIYQMRFRCNVNKNGYILAHRRCCRNETLTNIYNPLETGATWFVCLTEYGMNQCNSSPRFQDWPDVVICEDEPFIFDQSAFDPDGDSLAYTFYTPHIGGSIEAPIPFDIAGPEYDRVTYQHPFSSENVMDGNPSLAIDEESGFLTVTPRQGGQFLVGVLVEEWRNDSLLSKTRRDFQINVCGPANCEVPNDTLCIYSGDTIGLNLVIDTSPECLYTWEPLEDILFDDPNTFSNPRAFPGEDQNYRVILQNEEQLDTGHVYIRVEPRPTLPPVTLSICPNDTCQTISLPNTFDYVWSPDVDGNVFGDSIEYQFCLSDTGRYQVQTSVPDCPVLNQFMTVTAESPDSMCVLDHLTIDKEFTYRNGICSFSLTLRGEGIEDLCDIDLKLTTWRMMAGDTSILGAGSHFSGSFAAIPCIDTMVTVALSLMDSSRCDSVSVVQNISFKKVYEKIIDIDLSPERVCPGDVATILLIRDQADSILVDWASSAPILAESDSSLIFQVPDSLTTVTVSYVAQSSICSELICDSTIFIPVDTVIGPSPGVEFLPCTYKVQFSVGGSFREGDLRWDFGDRSTFGDTSLVLNPVYTYPGAGNYIVTVTSRQMTCSFDSIIFGIQVPEILMLEPSDTIINSCGPDSIVLSVQSNFADSIFWLDQFNRYLGSGTSVKVDPSVVASTTAIGMDSENCRDTSLFLLKPLKINVFVDAPQAICANEEFQIRAMDDSGLDLEYTWTVPDDVEISNVNDANPTISGTTNDPLIVRLRIPKCDAAHGFFDTTLVIKVISVNIVSDEGEDNCILEGESVTLNAENNANNPGYDWSPGSESTQEIIVSPLEETIYEVRVTDMDFDKTCIEMDTIAVFPCIWDVPSAFSPNRNTNNDEFRVRVAKDRDLSPFNMKILNRWGEEVFNSVDIGRGWDGRYRGKELPPDVYAWCIQVTCPDGSTDIRSGNVTLLR